MTIRQVIIGVVIGLGYVLPSVFLKSINVYGDILIGFSGSLLIIFGLNYILLEKLDKKIPLFFGVLIIFLGAAVVYSVA